MRRFVDRSLARLGSGLEGLKRGFKAPLAPLPQEVRDRLEAEALSGTILIDFDCPATPRCRPVQRSHPLVSVLAETLLERTLSAPSTSDEARDPGDLGRVGCWISAAVDSVRTVALLRLRHQLVTQRGEGSSTLLVEEATAIAWAGASAGEPLCGDGAFAILGEPPAADPPPHVKERSIAQALEQLGSRRGDIDAFARERADTLLLDHRRVREASGARGSYSVNALLPADIIGLYVLLPKVG